MVDYFFHQISNLVKLNSIEHVSIFSSKLFGWISFISFHDQKQTLPSSSWIFFTQLNFNQIWNVDPLINVFVRGSRRSHPLRWGGRGQFISGSKERICHAAGQEVMQLVDFIRWLTKLVPSFDVDMVGCDSRLVRSDMCCETNLSTTSSSLSDLRPSLLTTLLSHVKSTSQQTENWEQLHLSKGRFNVF